MSRKVGSFTLDSSPITLNIGFQPTYMEFWVTSKGSSDSIVHLSEGRTTGTNSSCNSLVDNGSVRKSYASTSKCISVYEIVSSTSTEVLNGTWSAWSSSPAGVTLTSTATNVNYDVNFYADNL